MLYGELENWNQSSHCLFLALLCIPLEIKNITVCLITVESYCGLRSAVGTKGRLSGCLLRQYWYSSTFQFFKIFLLKQSFEGCNILDCLLNFACKRPRHYLPVFVCCCWSLVNTLKSVNFNKQPSNVRVLNLTVLFLLRLPIYLAFKLF